MYVTKYNSIYYKEMFEGISIIIPTYNEESSIEDLIKRLRHSFSVLGQGGGGVEKSYLI